MDRLPDEILMKILGYLNTFELIQFCRAFDRYSCFLGEKNITRIVNFSKRFETGNFNLCFYITTNFNCCHIKVLKINGLYWIEAAQLRTMIRKLENLRELHAVDTKLGLCDEDISLYHKLKKLAVSVEDDFYLEGGKITKDTLKNLQLSFLNLTVRKVDHYQDFTFLGLLTNLEEIWIDNKHAYSINDMLQHIMDCIENLKKIVIRTSYTSHLNVPIGFTEVFHYINYNQCIDLVFEKIQIPIGKLRSIYEPKDELEKAWEVFSNNSKNLPCGPMETRLIHLKEDVKNIYFHDLNFCHTITLCDTKYINAALQILSSKNCTKLKRLAFRTCLLNNTLANVEEHAPIFKKQGIGLPMKCDNHPFRKIAENLKSLSHLAITNCSECISGSVLSSYSLISHFENLQKLSLEISPFLDGSFLTQVIKSCKRLESLSLTCFAQNEKFIINMCQALKEAEALRDFRLEYTELAISKLLDSFNSIKSRKLLRIFLKYYSLIYYTEGVDIFSDFMEKNPQLVFFFMVINKNSIKQNSDIQKILNRYKEGNQAKIFYVNNDATTFTLALPIPAAHHDIIYNRTDVSVIDFDDF